MNIGIQFEIPQERDTFLWKILNNNTENFNYWKVDQNNIYDAVNNDFLFTKEVYGTAELLNLAETKHYILSVKMQAYEKISDFGNISTFEDFAVSDCGMILLIYDAEYVEIYSKSEAYLSKIYDMAAENGFSNPEFITEENRERTRLDVM